MTEVSRRIAWRNGGGWTRVLAQSDEQEPFTWRISRAEIERDGPFSNYSGYDRTIVSEDEPFTLEFIDGERVAVKALQPFSFDGEREVWCRLHGKAVTAFNVMTLRGACTHTVRIVDGEIDVRIERRAPGTTTA
ncbi:MAG TPA: HutD family protein [Candidatus Baltobacteraceae bacterium]